MQKFLEEKEVIHNPLDDSLYDELRSVTSSKRISRKKEKKEKKRVVINVSLLFLFSFIVLLFLISSFYTLKTSNNALQGEVSELNASKLMSQKKIDELTHERDYAKGCLSFCEKNSKDSSLLSTEYENKLRHCNQGNNDLSNQLKQIKNEYNELNHSYMSVQQRTERTLNELTKENMRLNEQYSSINREGVSTDAFVTLLTESNKNYNEQVNELINENHQIRFTIDSLRVENKRLKDRESTSMKRIDEQEGTILAMINDKTKQLREYNSLVQAYDELSSSSSNDTLLFEYLKMEKKRMIEKENRLSTIVTDKDSIIKQLSKELSSIKQELSKQMSHNEKMRESEGHLQSEHNQLKQAYDKSRQTLNKKEREYQLLSESMTLLQSKHNKLETGFNQILMTNNELNACIKDQSEQIYRLHLNEAILIKNMLGSDIFTSKDDIDTLSSWISPSRIVLKLLYKSSQHGDDLNAFHNRVDNNPQTIVLIQTEENERIGGITYNIWNKPSFFDWLPFHNNPLKVDPYAFIFNLDTKQKYRINDEDNAIASTESYLILFGKGDLVIPNNFLSQRGSSDFSHCYGDVTMQGNSLINKRIFAIREVEVFSFQFIS